MPVRVDARPAFARVLSGSVTAAIVLALLFTVPLWIGSAYQVGRLQLGLTYVLAALGLNLVYGLAGEFTLGHAVIMAVGAYTSGILSYRVHMSVWLALLAGIGAGIVVSLLLAAPSIRVRGAYLGLLTLFAILIVPDVIELTSSVSGGDYGLAGIPSIRIGSMSPSSSTYELSALAVVLVVAITWNLVRSPWGARFALLREAPHATEAIGLRPVGIKLYAYVLYGVVASLAGILVGYGTAFVSSNSFDINLTLLILTGVILGGKGTIWGPVVGMVPLVALTFYIGEFSSVNPIVFGAVLLVIVILFPNGVVPAVKTWVGARRQGSASPDSRAELRDGEFHTGIVHTGLARSAPRALTDSGAVTGATFSGPVVLAVSDLAKSFGGVQAVGGISFEVAAGEVVGLLGQNGSGKSTALNLICGFYRPDRGDVRIDNRSVAGLRAYKVARLGVGRTFQVPRLVDGMTVGQNIAAGLLGDVPLAPFGGMVNGPSTRRRTAQRFEEARGMQRLLGLEDEVFDLPADVMPLGIKRIVEVARAAIVKPKLLLLDEPAAGLNVEERAQLAVALRSLRAQQVALVVVEHNVDFVLDICDRLVLLEQGMVACVADPRQPATWPAELIRYVQYSETQ